MENTLVNKSNIVFLKSKFFIFRAVAYASFLMIPILAQKSLSLSYGIQLLMMLLYILFMAGQWFMLGKEIDHNFNIYFKTNSSMDRVLYRLLLGMFLMIFYFNILAFFPGKWIYNMFWVTWVILGLYYSWPTRGKIIKESVTTNFSEFKYLDGFEKTLLFFIILMFVTSIPEFTTLTNQDALKLYFDPLERMSGQWWNFMMVNYYPFKGYPDLYRLAWSMHFYVVGLGLFLISLYGMLRFFVSRRLSLLGVFVTISSWPLVKLLSVNLSSLFLMTFTLIWLWGVLWSSKASSYRICFGLGLLGFYGVLLEQSNFPLLFVQMVFTYYLLNRDKTSWFKLKMVRYLSFGAILIVLNLISFSDRTFFIDLFSSQSIESLLSVFERKAFFVLAPIGAIFIFVKFHFNWEKLVKVSIDRPLYRTGMYSFAVLFIGALILSPNWMNSLGWLWVLTWLSLIPLEFLFQATFRLRSERNIIYLFYILICLLDSHLEIRIREFYHLLFS